MMNFSWQTACYLSCLLAKDKQEIDELEKALPAWTAVIGLSGNDEEEVAYKNLTWRMC